MDVFNRNHAHRSAPRTRRGYIFLDKDFAGGWQGERTKMSAAVPAANITVHADAPAFAANQKASIANYIASFQQEHLVCQYVMHGDWLNHYFAAESGQDVFPPGFPATYSSPGSGSSVSIARGSSVKEVHLIAVPNKSALSRFYLLGGCDVAKILFRPQLLVDGEQTSSATPLNRQYARTCSARPTSLTPWGWPCSPTTSPTPPGTTRCSSRACSRTSPSGRRCSR
jgi:hypothetical protein